jgi:SAM-dependent methyltransferase
MATSTAIRSVPVEDLYSRWGADYDQGKVNNMQGLDDFELETLLPKFLSLVLSSCAASNPKIVDFGCGTGRNTLKLLDIPNATIIGLDATQRLLEVAARRCQERLATLMPASRAREFHCEVWNPLITSSPPEKALNANGLISTLVLEHFTLAEFFEVTSRLLAPGGYLLATDTHEDLARIANGSVVDKDTGELLWSVSHMHTAEDVEKEAQKWGLELVEVQEAIPKDPDMVGAMRGHWEGVKCWVGFVLRKK